MSNKSLVLLILSTSLSFLTLVSSTFDNKRNDNDSLIKQLKNILRDYKPVTVLLSIKSDNNRHDHSLSISDTSSEESRLDPSDCILDNFSFHEELGRGTTAIAYKIKHNKTEKYYAAKKPLKSMTLALAEQNQLSKELKILKSLDSSFVAKFHCIMKDGNDPIQIFEYIHGLDLKRFQQDNFISENDFKIYVSQLILALQYLRRRKISILDMKADNIIIDTNGNLKVIDFGLSESFENETESSSLSGNKYHYSPERIKVRSGMTVSFPLEPHDWYSLGVVIYRLFYTGELPLSPTLQKHYQKEEWESILDSLEEREHLKFISNSHANESRDLSTEAKSLVKGLLNPNPIERMEFVDRKMMNHPWFIKNDPKWWEKIQNKSIKPKHCPVLLSKKTNRSAIS